jgi:hypothetical protein
LLFFAILIFCSFYIYVRLYLVRFHFFIHNFQ